MFSEKHRGEIVADVVKKKKYPIKLLAERLNVTRNTLYNKFREHDLSFDFIKRTGDIVSYDFSQDFPEMKCTIPINEKTKVSATWHIQQKHAQLKEKHEKLLQFLKELAEKHNLEDLKEDLKDFEKDPSIFSNP